MSVETVRAMYHPGMELTMTTTPFGMKKSSPPTLYQSPVQGKVIYRYDMLTSLADKFGDNLVRDRDYLFKLISKDVTSDKEYSAIVAHCYRRYAAFANYIDLMFCFGTNDIDMLQIVTDAFKSIAEGLHYNKATMGGRFLMEDLGYVYVAYDEGLEPPIIIEGVEVYRA